MAWMALVSMANLCGIKVFGDKGVQMNSQNKQSLVFLDIHLKQILWLKLKNKLYWPFELLLISIC